MFHEIMGKLLPPRTLRLTGLSLVHERPPISGSKDSGQLLGNLRTIRVAQTEDADRPSGPGPLQQDVHEAGLPLRAEQEEFDWVSVEQTLLSVPGPLAHADDDPVQPVAGEDHDDGVDQGEQLLVQRGGRREVQICRHW